MTGTAARNWTLSPLQCPKCGGGLELPAPGTGFGQRLECLGRLVEKVEAAIERLREYRQALITAAVTGKIDVRDKAPGPAAA